MPRSRGAFFLSNWYHFCQNARKILSKWATRYIEGISDDTTWNFTIDTTVPLIESTEPVHATTTNSRSADLVVTMNETITKGTGYIVIRNLPADTVFQTIDVTSANVTAAGNLVTIKHADFVNGASYAVRIANTCLADLAGNSFTGITDNTTWNFTVDPPPTIKTLNPADDVITKNSTANLVLTMSENVTKGTGNILIRRLPEGTTFQTIPVASSGIVITDNIISIAHGVFVDGNYAVQIEGTCFKDVTNNLFAGISDDTTWNFSIDSTPPTIVVTDPADGTTVASKGMDLVLTLSENVTKGTGNIVIRNLTDGNIFQTIDVTTANVTVAGNVVTIKHNNFLNSERDYAVQIANTCFTDSVGNAFAGISDTTTWNFTVDAVPSIISLDPADDESRSTNNFNLVMTMSERVFAGTGNIVIRNLPSGTTFQSIAVGSVNINTNIVTINPNNFPDGEYSVQIANTCFRDNFFNYFEGIYDDVTWNFKVDNANPTLTSTDPADNATTTPNADLLMTMSEPVVKGTGFITIKNMPAGTTFQSIDITSDDVSISGNVVRIKHNAFANGALYAIRIANTCIQDPAGNSYVGITNDTTWNFGVDAPPAISALSPADNAATKNLTGNLVLTMSENVTKGTGSIVIRNLTTGSTFQTIDVTSADVTIAANVVTINPNDFTEGEYSVQIANTCFKDATNNYFAGISDDVTWNFTVDTTAPTIVSTNPVKDTTSLSRTAPLVLMLNENLAKGSGNIEIRTLPADTVFQTIAVGSTGVSISDGLVTIMHADFGNGASYAVRIANTCFTDLAGNAFSGIADSSTWRFTIDPVPTIAALNPIDNTATNSANAALVLTMSENVTKGTGNIVIRSLPGGTTFQTIDVTSGNVSVAGSIVTIAHNAFTNGAQYAVQVESTCFADLQGNPFEGIDDDETWNFSVDTIAPTLVSTDPVDEGTPVIDADLVLTLSEPVVKGAGNIVIKSLPGGTVFQTIPVASTGVTINGSVVTIKHANFTNAVSYAVQIANTCFVDAAANAYAGISSSDTTTWNFTVDAAPVISSLSPLDNTLTNNKNVALVMTMSENVIKGTGNVIIKKLPSGPEETIALANVSIVGAVVTISHAAFDDGQFAVRIENTCFVDSAGNPFAGISDDVTWNFTVDTTAPVLDALQPFVPADGATLVRKQVTLVMKLNEPVKKGSGNIQIWNVSNNNQFQLIDVTSANVTITDDTISITHNTFANWTEYAIRVPSTCFLDMANNSFAGFTDSTTWNFTTSNVN